MKPESHRHDGRKDKCCAACGEGRENGNCDEGIREAPHVFFAGLRKDAHIQKEKHTSKEKKLVTNRFMTKVKFKY